MWRERRGEIESWSTRERVVFYGSALLIVTAIGLYFWRGPARLRAARVHRSHRGSGLRDVPGLARSSFLFVAQATAQESRCDFDEPQATSPACSTSRSAPRAARAARRHRRCAGARAAVGHLLGRRIRQGAARTAPLQPDLAARSHSAWSWRRTSATSSRTARSRGSRAVRGSARTRGCDRRRRIRRVRDPWRLRRRPAGARDRRS